MSTKTEQQSALNELTSILRDANVNTLYTVLRHVSTSGMQREISVKAVDTDKRLMHLDWLVSTALHRKQGKQGIKVMGCGMDMGFHLVDHINSATGLKLRHEWV